MKKSLFIFFILLIFISCKDKKNYEFTNEIVPTPAFVEFGKNVLNVSDEIYIIFEDSSEDGKKITDYLTNFLSKNFSPKFINEAQDKKTNIFISIDEELPAETYSLDIDNNGVYLKSGDHRGLFWGIQTLRQLFPVEIEKSKLSENFVLPHVKIFDKPQFRYRGMHLDVCRHFFSVEDVKSYIDLLVMHKFNTFHFHLTDDQGWRVDIKALPKLAEIASQRKETVIKKNTGIYDGIPYGGYFTHDEIRDIVKYAEDRFITVIPEIEMPGHALAALSAYPEIGCVGGSYDAATSWGVFDDIFCAGNEETFHFLEKVIDEICELFPNSPYIHVGGDEAPKVRWEKCPKCQKRIKDEGLSNEHELQSYFVQRMEKYINSKGKRIIGWDEILEGGLAPNATVMSWRGEEGGIDAARQGHDFIMNPTSHCYFDYYQSEDIDNEPFAICCLIDCEKIYYWDPVPNTLSKDERKHMLGVQANLWTEYILDRAHIQYMVLPRMAVLSEVAWSKAPRDDYSEFQNRLQSLFKRYDALGYNYAKHELITEKN
ncbi:MAG: beta-N-acetylhexosaminidase [Bacteroidales bacterium]|jgi:hexosaminidase|nr:beta-N-acetylhexosaminidase [Bacteroidales bacterium]